MDFQALHGRLVAKGYNDDTASRQEGAKKVPGDLEGLFTLREVRDFRRKAPSAKDLASQNPPPSSYICSEQMYMALSQNPRQFASASRPRSRFRQPFSLRSTFPEAQGLPVPQLDIARDKGLSYAMP